MPSASTRVNYCFFIDSCCRTRLWVSNCVRLSNFANAPKFGAFAECVLYGRYDFVWLDESLEKECDILLDFMKSIRICLNHLQSMRNRRISCQNPRKSFANQGKSHQNDWKSLENQWNSLIFGAFANWVYYGRCDDFWWFWHGFHWFGNDL